MPDRYRVEVPRGEPYMLTRLGAETLLVTLRAQGEQVDGDLTEGFAYTVYSRVGGFEVGRVRVVPERVARIEEADATTEGDIS